MAVEHMKQAVGVFRSLRQVEGALTDLRAIGFPMSHISTMTRERHIRPNQAQSGATTGAIVGGTVGGVFGLVVGLGAIAATAGAGALPILGSVALALTSTVTSGVMGAAGGGALGALMGYGIPQQEALEYRQRIYQGEYVMTLGGTIADIRRAEPILRHWKIENFQVFDRPAAPLPSSQA